MTSDMSPNSCCPLSLRRTFPHGTFGSPQEVLENVFAKVPEHFEQFELRPELWIEAGDDVVVTDRVVARTHASRKLDAPYATCSPSGTERSAATTTSTTRHYGQPHCLEPAGAAGDQITASRGQATSLGLTGNGRFAVTIASRDRADGKREPAWPGQ
jgi:hypothetical protein